MKLIEIITDGPSISVKELQNSNKEEFDIFVDMVIELIKKDCQPWLNEANRFAYRGIMERNKAIFTKQVRQDRVPRDTSLNFQIAVDEMLERAGFTALRRNTVFVSSSESQAADYAFNSVFLVFPIGEFSYTWNKYYNDLIDLYEASDMRKYINIDPKSEERVLEEIAFDFLHELGFKPNYKTDSKSLNKFIEEISNLPNDNWQNKLAAKQRLLALYMKDTEIQNIARKRLGLKYYSYVESKRFWNSKEMYNDGVYESFQNTDLNEALSQKNKEIGIRCDKYYAITVHNFLIDSKYESFRSNLASVFGFES